MLLIFYLSDGVVYNVATGWKNLDEYYGNRAEEMKKVFGGVYLPFDRYVYDHHFLFKYNQESKQLEFKGEAPSYIQNLINNSRKE